jgi:hypothetical protein
VYICTRHSFSTYNPPLPPASRALKLMLTVEDERHTTEGFRNVCASGKLCCDVLENLSVDLEGAECGSVRRTTRNEKRNPVMRKLVKLSRRKRGDHLVCNRC